MLTLSAQIVVQVLAWPLVLLLLRNALRRRQTSSSIAAAGLLAAYALEILLDPAAQNIPLTGTLNAVLHLSIAVLLATYPDGQFTPRWTILPVLLMVVLQIGNGISGFRWDTEPWWWISVLAVWAALLGGGQLVRYRRRSTAEERRQASWPLLAVLTQFVTFGLAAGILTGMLGELDNDASRAVAVLLNCLVGLGFAIGLVAPSLFRVDRLLRSVIAFGIVSFALLATFAGLTAGLEALGMSEDSLRWLGGLVVAVLTYPLARRAGRVADRIVYRGRADPLRTLDELGDRLDGALDPLRIPQIVVRTVCDALAVEGARLRSTGVLDAAWGVHAAEPERFAVVFQGEQLAMLEVRPRAAETELSAHDRTVIAHLSRQAGAALFGARAIIELVEARSRLVIAREEERRRLRRDLHDDLAPTFAGLGMVAAVVREYATSGDPRAADAAAGLVAGLVAATRQIREIAYDLRPPVLDDQGLVAAILDRVQPQDAVPRIELRAPTARLLLPAAVEAAALRIVQEAVVNVRRHAAASRCMIDVVHDGAWLSLTIEDDGCGMPGQRREGIGLQSIRERAAELGGSVEIESPIVRSASGRAESEGGSRLRVVFPLPASASLIGEGKP